MKFGSTMHAYASEHSPDTEFKPRGEAARGLVDFGFSGSPSFVAVMQPTDLR